MTLSAVHKSARYFTTPLGDHVRVLKLHDLELKCVHQHITVSHPKPLAIVSGVRHSPRRPS